MLGIRSRLAALAIAAPALAVAQAAPSLTQPRLGSRSAPILQIDGLKFKDLNRSGVVEPYEDWRLTPDARARDLVSRMTVEEKAGAMMHGTARSVGPMGIAGVGTTRSAQALRLHSSHSGPRRSGWRR